MSSEADLHSSIPNFKDESFHIDRWWKAMWDGCRYREELENLTIVKVRWFKEKKGVTHEYLVFSVDVKNPKRMISLNIERSTNNEVIDECLSSTDPLRTFLGDEIDSIPLNDRKACLDNLRITFEEERKNVSAREERFSSRGAFLSSKRSLKKSDPSVALDTTRRCELIPEVEPSPSELNAECILTLTFDQPNTPRFFLRDLSFMARAVRESHPTYSWAKHNCYWFARTLADVIIRMKNPIITPPTKVGMTAGCAYLGPFSRNLIRPNREEVSRLIPVIQSYIDHHDKKIENEWEEGRGGLLKANRTIEERDLTIEERNRTIIEQRRRIAELEASQKPQGSDPTNCNFDVGRSSTYVH